MGEVRQALEKGGNNLLPVDPLHIHLALLQSPAFFRDFVQEHRRDGQLDTLNVRSTMQHSRNMMG
jgi:hypothetical protein